MRESRATRMPQTSPVDVPGWPGPRYNAPMDDEDCEEGPGVDPVEIPIDGVLDLHTFSPRDVKDLVPTYLQECAKRGITQVRIIHGKGTGTLRRIVRSILDEEPGVISYHQDDLTGGSWERPWLKWRLTIPPGGTPDHGAAAVLEGEEASRAATPD